MSHDFETRGIVLKLMRKPVDDRPIIQCPLEWAARPYVQGFGDRGSDLKRVHDKK